MTLNQVERRQVPTMLLLSIVSAGPRKACSSVHTTKPTSAMRRARPVECLPGHKQYARVSSIPTQRLPQRLANTCMTYAGALTRGSATSANTCMTDAGAHSSGESTTSGVAANATHPHQLLTGSVQGAKYSCACNQPPTKP